MNRKLWIGTLAFALALGACSDGTDESQPAGAADETPAADAGTEAATAAESGVIYVDVRTPAEYARGHVEGARLIPHDEMAERWEVLEPYRDRHIVLYCRSGRRSGIAQDILERHGFDNVTNGGGLSDLVERGVPTTR